MRNIFNEDPDLRDAWRNLIGALVEQYKCFDCNVMVGNESGARAHENQRHDGAQTCWSYREAKGGYQHD